MLEINLSHLTCGTFALQKIQFSLQAGETCAILGLNGAGKSTLLKSLTGIYPCPAHSFLWNKKTLSTSLVEYIPPFIQPQLKIQTRYFLEASLLKLRLTQEDTIRLENISRFLKITNLLKKDLHVLSSGEMSKVLLAKALLSRKPIILMDEPTS
jgi:ABC-type Mn2+/Zn2+ transport system ATPase subunit